MKMSSDDVINGTYLLFVSVSSGVKQGGVISPLPFTIYIDTLCLEVLSIGLGCYVGLTYACDFGYADDIALITQLIYGLEK